MMRLRLSLALALLAMPALAFAQQTYRCKDDRGKTVYLSIPRAGCTDMQGRPVTAKAVPTKPAAAPVGRTEGAFPKPQPPIPPQKTIGALPSDPAQRTVDCRALRQQRDWLMSDEGRKVEMHAARVSQVEQNMRGCR